MGGISKKNVVKATETGLLDSSMENVIVVETLLKYVLMICPRFAAAAVAADVYVLGVVVSLARIRDPLHKFDLSILCW